MAALEWLLPLALAAIGLVALVGLFNRILARMAFRNALRRPRQSLMVILGLLVGTAIVGGSLVAGDSMEYSIVKATYDAFQEIDETVFLDGYNFFPQSIERDLAQDPELAAATDAIGSNTLTDAAVTNQRTKLYEPTTLMVGFDPVADLPFGPFRSGGARFTGESLAEDDVVLNRALAEKLDARVGDVLTLNFSQPLDPAFPSFQVIESQVDVSVTPGPLPLGPDRVETRPWTRTFRIEGTVVYLTVALAWPAAQGQDLDLVLTDPAGARLEDAEGSTTAPDFPVLFNVTGTLANPVPRGEWTLSVTAKAAYETPFNITIARFEPVFNLTEFEHRIDAFREQYPDVDPSDLEFEPPRVSKQVRVAFISDVGKGPDFRLPTPYNFYLRLDVAQTWLNRTDQVNFVKVSNPGGVEAGARATGDVLPTLWEALNETKAAHPQDVAIQELQANADKAFWLDRAKEIGQLFSVFLAFIGSFSVLAGLLLIINIFTMLAEERRAELGMSRAVGLRRRHLTRLFTLEGAYYALPAAILGTLLGLGLAYGLIWGFNYFGDEEVFPSIPYRVEASSLTTAFATGILLTLATVYVGARRASRLNIVRAVRQLEEPDQVRGRLTLGWGIALTVVGFAWALGGYAVQSLTGQILGPGLAAIGVATILRRVARRKTIYPPVALALLLYYVFHIFEAQRYETFEENVMGPVRSILMAICLVVILVYSEGLARGVGWVLQRVPPFRSLAHVATSYPLQRKFRTGLTLTMFGVILLVVSLFTIFGALFTPNPAKESGGYHIEATANQAVDGLEGHGNDPAVLDLVDHYETVPYFVQYGGDLVLVDNTTHGEFGPPLDYVYGIDSDFAARNRFSLLHRDARYASDADAYAAVAASDDLTIVAYPYSTDEQGNDGEHGVGDWIQVEARGGTKPFRIVGVQEQVHFHGVSVSQPALRSMFSNTDTLFLIALDDPAQDEDAAKRFEAAYRDIGMDAASIRVEVLNESQQFNQIFTLIRLFLGLGLIVGIMSLGIVTARSIIERRQEIGMLRALGFRRREIRRTFLLEMLTTVTLGILIGAAIAILVSFALWYTVVRVLKVDYVIPWDDLGVIALIAFVATTLATLAPIIRASRTPPAEALRYIE